MRLGRLGELSDAPSEEGHRGVRLVLWRGREVGVLQYRRDALLRECDFVEVRVAVGVVDQFII